MVEMNDENNFMANDGPTIHEDSYSRSVNNKHTKQTADMALRQPVT